MRSSQNSFLLFFCAMAIVSLACLSTAESFVPDPAGTKTPAVKPTMMPADAVVAADPTRTETTIVESECAAVVANKALHLRADPDPDAQIMAFMQSGEVVQVISADLDGWWLIEWGDLRGYARSRYLEFADCR